METIPIFSESGGALWPDWGVDIARHAGSAVFRLPAFAAGDEIGEEKGEWAVELFSVFTQLMWNLGGSTGLWNAGFLFLALFVVMALWTGRFLVLCEGPLRDPGMSLVLKLMVYAVPAAFGVLLLWLAAAEIFGQYPQFYALDSLFSTDEGGGMFFSGRALLWEGAAVCLICVGMMALFARVAGRSVVAYREMGFKQLLWRACWGDILVAVLLLVFVLVMQVRSVLLSVAFDFTLGNYLFGAYFAGLVYLALRAVLLLTAVLLMLPGHKERAERPLRGDSPLERFYSRVRRMALRKVAMGVVVLLLMGFVFWVAGDEVQVASGERAVEEGFSSYGDKKLRFDDAYLLYAQEGYLRTAQGTPTSDLYFAEVQRSVFLAIYSDHGQETGYEYGRGNTVIGVVQGFRDAPEKKFGEVIESLGIPAGQAVLLPHPVKYEPPSVSSSKYLVYGLMALLPLVVLIPGIVVLVNPRRSRGVRQLERVYGEGLEDLLMALQTELEGEVLHRCRGVASGSVLTRNFYYYESVSGVRAAPIRDIIRAEQPGRAQYRAYLVNLYLPGEVVVGANLDKEGMELLFQLIRSRSGEGLPL